MSDLGPQWQVFRKLDLMGFKKVSIGFNYFVMVLGVMLGYVGPKDGLGGPTKAM